MPYSFGNLNGETLVQRTTQVPESQRSNFGLLIHSPHDCEYDSGIEQFQVRYSLGIMSCLAEDLFDDCCTRFLQALPLLVGGTLDSLDNDAHCFIGLTSS